ncbi:hypothetical protein OsJ_35216 [Oryza sativa Japonica Group]|uniref:Uncharacterized protein n=1 Tax=Oryza sativa subsp. japonica TaxID=39947 RepID=B9GBW0_ORYSJ|nr:hypothetical protein OsJ_35216 [Oryza sativa Japonica Group]
MMYMRATHRDEEGKKVTEKVAVPETRHPDTARHFERKLDQQGLHRMERHPANGSRGIGAPPPNSIPSRPPSDRNDPNYEEEEGDHEREADVVGEVEVAKVAGDARDGVARVDVVAPPQLHEKLQLQPQ